VYFIYVVPFAAQKAATINDCKNTEKKMYSKSSRIQKSKGGCANAKLEIIQQKNKK